MTGAVALSHRTAAARPEGGRAVPHRARLICAGGPRPA